MRRLPPPASVNLAYLEQKCAKLWQTPNLMFSARNLQKKISGGAQPVPKPHCKCAASVFTPFAYLPPIPPSNICGSATVNTP